MIYTITSNPAIDLVVQMEDFQAGQLNRVDSEAYVAGGKGINISILLKRLGHDSIATGFVGGFTGGFVKDSLAAEGVETAFVEVDGISRINLKLHAQEETEINTQGPSIGEADFQRLMDYLADRLEADDVIFLAGNAAPGMTADSYLAIAKLAREKQAALVLDSNKDLLTHCLPEHPFLIKPNHHELGEIFGIELKEEAEIITYAKKLQKMGARHIIVSRGGDGALLVTEDGQIFRSTVPHGQVVNSVGAGDSMLAGFMARYLIGGDYATSLQYGAASGSATAYSVGIATKELVQDLLKQIDVFQIA